MPKPPQSGVPPEPDPQPVPAPRQELRASRGAASAAPQNPDEPPAAVVPVVPVAPKTAAAKYDDAVSCAVFDDQRGRPCGQPVEAGTLTCTKHRVRPTRTQISRNDAARRRFGG